MRNLETWAPSKFVLERGRFMASNNPNELSPGSRLFGDLVASSDDTHLKNHCRGRLLDLGCGKVPFHALYRQYVSGTVCVDWSNSPHGDGHLDAECDLTKDLPFADASFDCILLSDVLEHIPTPDRLWREMSRLLKPGGKLLLSVPFFYWLREPYDYYRYTHYALRRFAEATGFEIILIKELGGAPEILVDIFQNPSYGLAGSENGPRLHSRLSVEGWLPRLSEQEYQRGLRNTFISATS